MEQSWQRSSVLSNPPWLSSGPQCSTWAPLELLSLTCSTNPAVCPQTHTHVDAHNTVPVSTDPNSSSSTGDFTHKGIGLYPVRQRGAVSTLTHILPFLTLLQKWCNALGFSPSPHPVPAHPCIFVPPSSPPFAFSLSFPPRFVQHHRARSSCSEVTESSGQTQQWKTFRT